METVRDDYPPKNVCSLSKVPRNYISARCVVSRRGTSDKELTLSWVIVAGMPDTDKWILESASSIRYIDPFAGSPLGSRSEAAEFVEEVEDEDDLVARRVGRSVRVGHRYGEAFAIRVKIERSQPGPRLDHALRPQTRLVCFERIAFDCVRRDHDSIVGSPVKQLVTGPRPGWVSAPRSGNLPFAAGTGKRANEHFNTTGFVGGSKKAEIPVPVGSMAEGEAS